jgi:hypothetical protein
MSLLPRANWSEILRGRFKISPLNRRGSNPAIASRAMVEPFGLYFYMEDVEVWAAVFGNEILGKSGPEDKPWGMYEFAMSDPDETLVRVSWPSRLRKSPPTAT